LGQSLSDPSLIVQTLPLLVLLVLVNIYILFKIPTMTHSLFTGGTGGHGCQGRSKNRPVGRSKSRPGEYVEGLGLSGRRASGAEALAPRKGARFWPGGRRPPPPRGFAPQGGGG